MTPSSTPKAQAFATRSLGSLQNFTCSVIVEKGKDVDVIGGLLNRWIETGATRCVRAAAVDRSHAREHLRKIAQGKMMRKLEALDDVDNPRARVVVWRFCNIADAVTFKGELNRDEDWEACNIGFTEDPCSKANRPRV